LVVRQWGGELIVDGVKVVFSNGDIAPFNAGHVVLLFLTHLNATDGDVYQTYRGFVGAFEIIDGHVKGLAAATNHVHGAFAHLPTSEFKAEIRKRRR
jgi:hypothetical protein